MGQNGNSSRQAGWYLLFTGLHKNDANEQKKKTLSAMKNDKDSP